MRYADLIKGFLLVVLLSVMAACDNEEEILQQSEDKQSVQLNITRATMDGNDWAWKDGDKIGVNIKGFDEATATNHTLTYNGTWKADPVIGTKLLPATTEAWWPNTASISSFSFSHDNQSIDLYGNQQFWLSGTVNQSTEQNFAKSDWMTSEQLNLSSPSFDIELRHRLCKVTVILNLDGWDAEPTITDVGYITMEENDISGSIPATDFLLVEPLQHTVGGKLAYSAIISTYMYWGGQFPPLMKLIVNGTAKYVSLPNGMLLTLGSSYTFNLKVKNPNATTRSTGSSECELELVDVQDMNDSKPD